MHTDTATDRYHRAQYELSEADLLEAFPTGDPDPNQSDYGVRVEDWGPVVEKATGEKTGYTRRICGRPLADILRALSNHLESEGLVVDEYFDIHPEARYGNGRGTEPVMEWPDSVAHVMVYAVEGGSEGHYVHVDVRIMGDTFNPSRVVGLFLLKTFMGLRHAQRIANTLTEAFYR